MFLHYQCAAITIPLADPPPESEIPLYICHCTQCRLQCSSLIGTSAIFPATVIFPLSDALKSKLSMWTRPTKQGRSMDCYFCKTCGTRVMHRIREADGLERETVTLKGGCVFLQESGEQEPRSLDFSRATHLYTAHAVVDLERWPGARRYEGSPEVRGNTLPLRMEDRDNRVMARMSKRQLDGEEMGPRKQCYRFKIVTHAMPPQYQS